AMVEALADPAVKARFTDLGLDVAPREQQTPEGLAAFQKGEIDKRRPIIKEAGVTAQRCSSFRFGAKGLSFFKLSPRPRLGAAGLPFCCRFGLGCCGAPGRPGGFCCCKLGRWFGRWFCRGRFGPRS